MSEDKRYKTEWSFDFSTIGEKIADWARSIGLNDQEAVRQSTFTEAIDDAASAAVTLEFSVGKVRVHAINTANLLEADVTHVGEIQFEVQRGEAGGRPHKQIYLHQSGQASEWLRNVFGWIGSGQRLSWDVGLTTSVPLELVIRGGTGRSEYDLQALTVTDLKVSTGIGEVNLILPGGKYPARIECGTGKVDLIIPQGAEIDLDVQAGTGEVNLEIGEDTAVLARVRAGVGTFTIRSAHSGETRIEVQRGLGSLHLDDRFIRQSDSIWQTAGYDAATRRTTIFYRAGVGMLNVR
ncbi:MAG: hypothetical protein NZM00_08890 [Anaerolinea sp.]|nr:hypothetical protein [Anaerolinea sp.]